MPEIRIDRIIRRLIISRTSIIEDREREATRLAIVEIEVVKNAAKKRSTYTNGNATEWARVQKALSRFVCVVAVDKV